MKLPCKSMDKPMQEKLLKCISNSWDLISRQLEEYHQLAKKGLDHANLIVAHTTTAKNSESAVIEDTNIFLRDPDIKLKLLHAIRKEKDAESDSISKILDEMNKIFPAVIKECDKVFNFYSSLCSTLTIDEVTEGNETTLPISDMLAAFDRFKRYFTDDYLGRKYSIECCNLGGNNENILDLWDISGLSVMEQDLASTIAR